MTNPIQIRSAVVADMDAIIELVKAHAEYEKSPIGTPNKLDTLHKFLFHEQGFVKCFVAVQETEVVGYITCTKQFSTWDAEFYMYLDCLYLKEKIRGKGIGQKMMEQLKTYAKAQNCEMIQWQTPDFNTNAIGFYKRVGAIDKAKSRFFWSV